MEFFLFFGSLLENCFLFFFLLKFINFNMIYMKGLFILCSVDYMYRINNIFGI